NLVPSDHYPYPSRRSGQDDVAGQQGHDLGDVPDYVIQGEDENLGIRGLFDHAIHSRFHLHSLPGINPIRYNRTDWTECIESLCSPPLAVLLLQIAGGNVVGAGVAKDVRP